MSNFALDISKFAKKAGLSSDMAVVAVCSKLTSLVIAKTPVLSGRLRGNWFASIDNYSSEIIDDRRENQAKSEGLATAAKASGHIFTLTNNLPYAYRIEYLGWSSTKNPEGMVRVSMGEVANSLK